MTDYSNQIVETKKKYVFDYEGNDDVSISAFDSAKKKPLIVTLDNTSGSNKNFYSSSHYAETITVTGGHYSVYLDGCNSNKTVNLGTTAGNNVSISNVGKNKINAGDGGNNFSTSIPYCDNTITAGKGKDTYTLKSGKTKITDKGGENEYTITGGMNTITDKGSDGSTFTFNLVGASEGGSEGGITTIKSGAGADTLNIHNDFTPDSNELFVNADLGAGNDVVKVDFKEGSLYNANSSVLNLKTEKGEDEVYIYAGKRNTIDTGKDNDTVRIRGGKTNFISSGDGADDIAVAETGLATISTIKAGKGNDEINTVSGTNIIYGESGIDAITLWGGVNTVYGGGDTITANASDAVNTIYASSDTINLISGDNTIYTSKGGNSINISSNALGTANKTNSINLTKGNNTVNANSDKSGNIVEAEVNISAGKNTITLDGYSALSIYSSDKLKTAQTINIKGHAFASTQLGKGADVITDSSDKDVANGWMMQAGAGNDKFYISNGSNKQLYGQDGNDYFEITSGDSHKIYGGLGNDTIKVIGGTNHYIEANGGNDTIIVSGGSGYTINGYEGKDTFNISGGDSGELYGGDDNDTFNITGGTKTSIDGEKGNDIYNINMQSGSVNILESGGTNTVNVAKNFKGTAKFSSLVVTEAKYNVKFDKSYTLTSGANVKDDVITTSDSDITLYRTFIKDDGVFAPGASYRFVTNVQNEISDKSIDDRYVEVSTASFNSVNIGGKNYTLNFDKLQQDLVGWFNNHNTYADTTEVFSGGVDADINSLMAVYTKDTASCFVKA